MNIKRIMGAHCTAKCGPKHALAMPMSSFIFHIRLSASILQNWDSRGTDILPPTARPLVVCLGIHRHLYLSLPSLVLNLILATQFKSTNTTTTYSTDI